MTFDEIKALTMSWVPLRIKTFFERYISSILAQKQLDFGEVSTGSHLVLDTCMMSGPLFIQHFNNRELLVVSFAFSGLLQVASEVS